MAWVCGGVAANSWLRRELIAAGAADGFRVHVPSPRRCTDNAAMIAAAGLRRYAAGITAAPDLNADAALPMT